MESEVQCTECGSDILDVDVKCSICGASLITAEARRLLGAVVLGQYEILEVLGQGGMSMVYKGRHRLTGQEAALKILPPDLAAHSQVRSRFRVEAQALAQLDHPNIVHLYNFGEENGCFILAMQFVAGETLERLIWRTKGLDWRNVCQLGIETLKALDYAHGRGVVHRDMKPSNILVRSSDGSATVMDFGIAKMTGSTRLTATGQTMGTVRYMSPEQVRGQDLDHRTDIYSLAVSLYEGIVGDTPFDGATHFDIMTKHLTERPLSPLERGADIPRALNDMLMRAMAKNPEKRPATAASFRAALEDLLEGQSLPALRVEDTGSQRPGTSSSSQAQVAVEREGFDDLLRPNRRRGWRGLAIVGVAGALIAAIAAVSTARTPENPDLITSRTAGASQSLDASRVNAASGFDVQGMSFAISERFDDVDIEVMATSNAVYADTIRDEVVAARDAVSRFFRGRGVRAPLAWGALTVVVVAPHTLCDPRLFAPGEPPTTCSELDSHYRPDARTLFVVELDDRRARSLPYAIGKTLCAHHGERLPDCEQSLTEFVQGLEADGRGSGSRR